MRRLGGDGGRGREEKPEDGFGAELARGRALTPAGAPLTRDPHSSSFLPLAPLDSGLHKSGLKGSAIYRSCVCRMSD